MLEGRGRPRGAQFRFGESLDHGRLLHQPDLVREVAHALALAIRCEHILRAERFSLVDFGEKITHSLMR